MRLTAIQLTNYRSFEESNQIELGQITLFIGRNNTGKSTVVRAPLLLQQGMAVDWQAQIRKGENRAVLKFSFNEVNWTRDMPGQQGAPGSTDMVVQAVINGHNLEFATILGSGGTLSFAQFSHLEPNTYIYPILSTRKHTRITNEVAEERTNTVGMTVENLNNKVQRLSIRQHRLNGLFEQMCEELIGYTVASIPAPGGGQRAGIYITDTQHLPVDVMGEGVVSLLSFITDLCIAEHKLFIIEEPENDIHPQALKVLMQLIIESSKKGNQFLMSTHSNIVAKYLGSVDDVKIYKTDAVINTGEIPTSRVSEVPPTPEARIELLTSLGYELYDFDIWDGWLILEESTAEQLITQVLIPAFAPELKRLRTISVGGNEEAGPAFAEFNRLFRFAHLENHYKNRAWVILDGDERGRELIGKIRESYPDWDEGNFRFWSKENFEEYYPAKFKEEVARALTLTGKAKKNAKTKLILDVLAHYKDEPEVAKNELAKSAEEVISKLKDLEASLFPANK